MEEYLFRLNRIESLIEENRHASGLDACSIYSTVKVMCLDMLEHARDNDKGYASEKLTSLGWHVGAMYGFEDDNGNGPDAHYVQARTALNSLRTPACFGVSA